MKQFIADRHTTPETPVMDPIGEPAIPLYPTEQDLLDDLANLEVGQIVGTIDPAESELIGVLIQKIQALENGEKYSTEEVKTNKKWWDGTRWRNVYRKCFYSATNWANNTVIGNVPNFDNLVMIQSVSKNYSNSRFYTNYDDDSNANCATISINGDVIVNRLGAFIGSSPAHVTIEYTKTTD
jgi:hypothetical protein